MLLRGLLLRHYPNMSMKTFFVMKIHSEIEKTVARNTANVYIVLRYLKSVWQAYNGLM